MAVSCVLCAGAALLLVGLTSALPAVLDLRPLLLLVSGLASLGLFVARSQVASPVRRAGATAIAAGLGLVSVAAACDLTLAYRTEPVSFANGDVTLHGTLYLPPVAGKHPAVVLVHGSGRADRNESRFYARAYARSGIAALAYDKRGSGASSGEVHAATYAMLGDDAAQAVRLLRNHPQVDAGNVGLRGVSEGEWTAVLAARVTEPAFLVIVSGSAMTPAEQVAYETAERVRRAGFGADAARRAGTLYRQLSAFQRTGEGREALNRELAAASGQPWFDAAWYLEASVPEYDRVLQLSWFGAWRARMDFDALPLMAELDCPVLLQEGGADPKMDAEGAIERMREALARGGNAHFTGLLYPEATHGIIEWRLPGGLPPPWFASGYLDDQLDWVAAQVVPKP